MKYQAQPWHIPEETKQVAKAAFPKGSPYMLMRDEIGVIYQNSDYGELFSHRGKPAEAPGNLALVMIMQYAEGLTDEQAAEAVRGRIDWKYALGLRLTDPGFDASVLSRFRQRLLAGGEEMKLLDDMLAHFREKGWVQGSEQRTDSTHVVGAVRRLNRLELVGETLRAALSALAVVAPEWLQAQVTPDWFEMYGARFEGYRLPKKESEQKQLQLQIGQDGFDILAAVYEPAANEMGLSRLPAVQVLRQVWVQQYYLSEAGLQWREKGNLAPAAKQIDSPYDVQAHYSHKRDSQWLGYKVHLTESCVPGQPHLITHVKTTSAPVPDVTVTQEIQQALAAKELAPETHYVDKGYVDADNLVQAHKQQIDLVGPVAADSSWQGRDPAAFDLSHFSLEWSKQRALCPQGHHSSSWSNSHNAAGQPVIHVAFPRRLCHPCSARPRCTRSKYYRTLQLHPQPRHQALQAARRRQHTDTFKKRYRRRAGAEGMISQGVRSFHLRTCRYRGLAKTALQHILIAAAMNLTRIVCWLRGDKHARTRISPFAALAFNFT